MPILRLTQTTIGSDTYHVHISLEGDGLPRQTASARFAFAITAKEQERLRWYLEDFLQFPFAPAPETAARVEEARATNESEEELRCHINDAVRFCYQALDLTPLNAVNDLAVTHNQLGNIYDDAGDLNRALTHYCEAIRYLEVAGDIYHAAAARFNVAVALRDAGRLEDARDYAYAALRNFQSYEGRAAERERMTEGMIGEIEGLMRGREGALERI